METITFDTDLHEDLVAETTPEQREEYALYSFSRYTTDNPNYRTVSAPTVSFVNVREGFLTARISFEAELA